MVARLPIDDDNDDNNDEARWTLIEALHCFTHSLVELVSLLVMIGAKCRYFCLATKAFKMLVGPSRRFCKGPERARSANQQSPTE